MARNISKHTVNKVAGSIISGCLDSVVIVDGRGIICFVNNATIDLFGYSQKELLHKPVEMLMDKSKQNLHVVHRKNYMKVPVDKIMSADEPRELIAVKKDGSAFSAIINLHSVKIKKETYVAAIIRDLSEFKHNEGVIEQFGKIIDSSFDEVYIFEQDSLKFVQANIGALSNTGYSIEELQNMTPIDLKKELSLKEFKTFISPLISKEKNQVIFETKHTRKNGSTYPVEVRLQTSEIDGSNHLIAVVMDISERKHSQEILKESEKYLRAIVDSTPECVVVMGDDSRIFDINPVGLKMLGVNTKKEASNKKIIDYVKPEDKEKFTKAHERALKKSYTDTIEFDMVFGENITNVEMRIVPLSSPITHVVVALTIIRDITDRKKSEMEIQRLAFRDPLTDLFNRRTFEQHLNSLTAKYRRTHEPFALMIVDLDDFGSINNTLGHQVGDELLKQISKRLTDSFKRETDFVARYGGDEFIIILSGIKKKSEDSQDVLNRCKDIAQNLVNTLEVPYMLGKNLSNVTSSVGMAICLSSNSISSDEILRRADIAMYNAKKAGKNDYSIHPVT